MRLSHVTPAARVAAAVRLLRRKALPLAAAAVFPVALPAPLAAQAGRPPADSAARDSAQRILPVRVEVTRAPAADDRLPWAVATQHTAALRRAQPTLGIDEALADIPGVVVSNRYNYALDQRLSIRGAGSRANFGLRGVKVLLDGVPQSLPDGQSQLTNVDLAAMGQVEVLRGAASSLYGNGSGGVIAFTTDLASPERLGTTLRATAGSFGMSKLQARVGGRAGATVGAVSASRTTLDGFRQYSRADTRQLSAAVDRALPGGAVLALRGGVAETPLALNPGALTAAEYAIEPDSAAANNIRRGARRAVSQRYLSLRVHREAGAGAWSVAAYGQRRFVDNPLATAPPAPAGATNGTRGLIDRRVTGLRADATRGFEAAWHPRLSLALDVQRSADVRRNQRTTGGRTALATDTVFLFQQETVVGVGPSAQLQLEPRASVTLSLGARADRLAFRVDDHFLADGDDDSGTRTMRAFSGHAGAVWRARPWVAPYANLATAFETPTTTELNARQDGTGGFNDALGPQRIRSVEVGARGRVARRLAYEVAVFESTARDAIVQFLETGGRAYFRNAGRTRNRGVELGATVRVTPWLSAHGAWTLADYRFAAYTVPSAALPAPAVDTLDGNRLAGVPDRSWRWALHGEWRAATVAVEHTMQGAAWGNDLNTVRVPAWGRGQLAVRAAWRGTVRGWRVEPFGGVLNALDQRYVGAITLNGFGGRVLEPAPGRNWFAGLELAAPILR